MPHVENMFYMFFTAPVLQVLYKMYFLCFETGVLYVYVICFPCVPQVKHVFFSKQVSRITSFWKIYLCNIYLHAFYRCLIHIYVLNQVFNFFIFVKVFIKAHVLHVSHIFVTHSIHSACPYINGDNNKAI